MLPCSRNSVPILSWKRSSGPTGQTLHPRSSTTVSRQPWPRGTRRSDSLRYGGLARAAELSVASGAAEDEPGEDPEIRAAVAGEGGVIGRQATLYPYAQPACGLPVKTAS